MVLRAKSESIPCPTIHAGSPDYWRNPSEHLHFSLYGGVIRPFRPNQANLEAYLATRVPLKKPLSVGTNLIYAQGCIP